MIEDIRARLKAGYASKQDAATDVAALAHYIDGLPCDADGEDAGTATSALAVGLMFEVSKVWAKLSTSMEALTLDAEIARRDERAKRISKRWKDCDYVEAKEDHGKIDEWLLRERSECLEKVAKAFEWWDRYLANCEEDLADFEAAARDAALGVTV